MQTYEWLRTRIYRLEDIGHDPTNPAKAREKAGEWGEHIPLGLFWRVERPTYADLDEVMKEGPVLGRRMVLNGEEKAALVEGFR
jgi:2-oxoglutarate ferredoxin oxidoreductase subunit beta